MSAPAAMPPSPPVARYLACRRCQRLQPYPPAAAAGDDDAAQAAREAFEAFAAAHAGHFCVTLWRLDEAPTHADRPLWDPLHTVSFGVTDGQHGYVVTAGRATLDEPRVYRFRPGAITTTPAAVTVADDLLARGLDRALFPHALRPSTLARFVDAVRDVVAGLDPAALEPAFDDPDDPTVTIARLPDAAFAHLLARCAAIFDAADWPRVRAFLESNRGEDGLLALRLRHAVQIAA